MVQNFYQETQFNPIGKKRNYTETSIVLKESRLPYYIEVRTPALLNYIAVIFQGYSRNKITDWLDSLKKPGTVYELNQHIHIGYADQRDGRNSKHWWFIFFDDTYKNSVIQNINIQVSNINSKKVNNSKEWYSFTFRSKTEERIAHSLLQKKVLFFINSSCIMSYNDLPITNIDGRSDDRVEVDFLVFKNQKSMILEVDGEHHNKQTQIVRDYKRDRVFLSDGISTVRFTWKECYEHPMKVVDEFLSLFN